MLKLSDVCNNFDIVYSDTKHVIFTDIRQASISRKIKKDIEKTIKTYPELVKDAYYDPLLQGCQIYLLYHKNLYISIFAEDAVLFSVETGHSSSVYAFLVYVHEIDEEKESDENSMPTPKDKNGNIIHIGDKVVYPDNMYTSYNLQIGEASFVREIIHRTSEDKPGVVYTRCYATVTLEETKEYVYDRMDRVIAEIPCESLQLIPKDKVLELLPPCKECGAMPYLPIKDAFDMYSHPDGKCGFAVIGVVSSDLWKKIHAPDPRIAELNKKLKEE